MGVYAPNRKSSEKSHADAGEQGGNRRTRINSQRRDSSYGSERQTDRESDKLPCISG